MNRRMVAVLAVLLALGSGSASAQSAATPRAVSLTVFCDDKAVQAQFRHFLLLQLQALPGVVIAQEDDPTVLNLSALVVRPCGGEGYAMALQLTGPNWYLKPIEKDDLRIAIGIVIISGPEVEELSKRGIAGIDGGYLYAFRTR